MNKYLKWALCVFVVAVVAFFLFAPKAKAQGFQDEPTCFSWAGGHKSSGSYSKCNPDLQPVKKAPPVVTPVVVPPAPVVTPVVAAPAPTMSCPPPPAANKPVFIKKRYKPKPTCK